MTPQERERARAAAWFAFLAAVVFILLTLDLAYEVSLFLRVRGFLWDTVLLLTGLAGGGFFYLIVVGAGVRRPDAIVRALPFVALFLFAMVRMRTSPSERFHFVEYGALFLLALRAITVDVRGWAAYPLAIIAAGLSGWLDETLQGLSKLRYFDIEDLKMNVVAALLAACITAALFLGEPARVRFEHVPPPRDV